MNTAVCSEEVNGCAKRSLQRFELSVISNLKPQLKVSVRLVPFHGTISTVKDSRGLTECIRLEHDHFHVCNTIQK